MTTTHSAWRWGAALLLLVTAGAHVPLIRGHLHEAPYVAALFALLACVCVDLAFAVVVIDTDTVWFTSGLVCLAALVGFVASRTVGLPGIRDDVGRWTEPLGFPAVAAEAAMVALTVAHLVRDRGTSPDTRGPVTGRDHRRVS